MSWRVVMVTKPSKLDYSMDYAVVRDVESTVKIHLSEISVIIIENTASSITTALMAKMLEHKIKVIFCDEKRNPSSELIPYYGSHDCSRKLKSQIEWQTSAKQQVWTCIVTQKIKNQMLVLKHFDLEQYQKLEIYLEEMEFNDESNREGHAAKVYFNAMFGKSFSRSDDIPINAALNYGYSLILSCFNREIVCGGYLTQLGLFHDNVFNQYNLSCDMMEPFRPLIDIKVKNMSFNSFENEQKVSLVSVLNSELIIDNKSNTLLNTIKIYSKSVFDSIEQNDASLIKFPTLNYEL